MRDRVLPFVGASVLVAVPLLVAVSGTAQAASPVPVEVRIQLGAVTDGPSSPPNFVGLGTVSGMKACSAGTYGPFNTKTAKYEDNVVSWPSVEPADDYAANSLLAFAFAASDR